MPIYLTLQLTGSAAHHVTTVPGELLPHLFTLTHTEMRAVVFCHLNPKVTPSFPLRSVMLYVARTFLSIFPAEARKHERQTTILLDIDANLLLFSECHAFWRGIFFVQYHGYFIYGDF